MPLAKFEAQARQCHTTRQFHRLVKNLKDIIPYRRVFGSWGYPSRCALRYFVNFGYPSELIQWRFANQALWSSPIFREWRKTHDTILWCDEAARFSNELDPELFRRMVEAGVQNSIVGGWSSDEKDFYILFTADMGTATEGRRYLPRFHMVVPWLIQASQQAYPHDLLTKRETKILEGRMLGHHLKMIADKEHISPRTVQAHLTHIKHKLDTTDLINAVVIALRTGMALPLQKR